MDEFDPYAEWLEIAPEEHPVDYYRLLGLTRFEQDPTLIGAAADRQMAHVRQFQMGPRGRHTQRLLNELSTAKLCLLDAAARQKYDTWLREELERREAEPSEPVPEAAPAAPPAPRDRSAAPAAAWQSESGEPDGYSAEPEAPPRPAPAPPPQRSHVTAARNVATAPNEPLEKPRRGWFLPAACGVLVLATAAAVWWGGQHWMSDQPLDLFGLNSTRQQPDSNAEDSGQDNMGQENVGQESTRQQGTPPDLTVLQEAGGALNFTPPLAETRGPRLNLLDGRDVLSGWQSPEHQATWTFRVIKPGFFEAHVTYAAPDESKSLSYELETGKVRKTGRIRLAEGSQRFVTDIFVVPVMRSGKHTLTFRMGSETTHDQMALATIQFIPSGRTK